MDSFIHLAQNCFAYLRQFVVLQIFSGVFFQFKKYVWYFDKYFIETGNCFEQYAQFKDIYLCNPLHCVLFNFFCKYSVFTLEHFHLLVKFNPRYFIIIIFPAIRNGISFLDNSLMFHKSTTPFCTFTSCPTTFLKLQILVTQVQPGGHRPWDLSDSFFFFVSESGTGTRFPSNHQWRTFLSAALTLVLGKGCCCHLLPSYFSQCSFSYYSTNTRHCGLTLFSVFLVKVN